MRFLIDECLSPALVTVAHDAGYEACHVTYRAWSGESDTEVFDRALEGELVIVTNNRDDFIDIVGAVELHPGLVVLVDNVQREEQKALFATVLAICAGIGSMVNTVIEIGADGNSDIYELPAMK